MRTIRFIVITVIAVIAFFFLTIFFCNRIIDASAKGKLYSDTQSIPYNKVGLLLGTSKFLAGNRVNPYYDFRIDAAAKLWKEGKIRYIVASGDNSRKDYNEPKHMQSDLIKAGVDSSAIYLDYAGLRTFDSMIRLKKIFGQDSVTVISQQFHNERALYIASQEGIAAIGFNARDVKSKAQNQRERFARVKVFLDYLTGKDPKYLGPKVHIP